MSQSAFSSFLQPLKEHRARLEQNSILQLFDREPKRAEEFTVSEGNMLFDYSKNRLDKSGLECLLELAEVSGVEEARARMFSGEKINFTEKRAVLHTALRAEDSAVVEVDGENIIEAVREVQERAYEFARQVRDGEYVVSGNRVTDIVNIGIGGSDLGPVMCVSALEPYCDGPNIHFVSNVDGADFHDSTRGLDPQSTLFIIASKTFTTAETMANANLARKWVAGAVKQDQVGEHFVALSTNLEATAEFGIDPSRTFGFWDWVGGRYSVWSAIGLSLMIAIGPKQFSRFLEGARSADKHFCSRPLNDNVPVLMALIGIWHRNICNYPAQAILPYDNRLARFPAYLQQLDMESNGKHIDRDGNAVEHATGPIIWGEPGTNGQHAFYQLLHQGTDIVPCDFLVAARAHEPDQKHQRMLFANCLAQSRAMMIGRNAQEVQEINQGRVDDNLIAHRTFEGNRPSNTFLYEILDPFTLGQLIAFYEHKIFVQGIIWGINSFDQWGVELGKQLARDIEPLLESDESELSDAGQDPSTGNLIQTFQALSQGKK